MAWDTPDLSSVTDSITHAIELAVEASPLWTVNGGPAPKFNIAVTAGMPDSVRDTGGCQLTVSLVHIGVERAWRNAPTEGPRGRVNPQQPLGLALTYLLSAFAENDPHQEQQAMSIALACLHAQPIQKSATEEFTVTLETASLDELGRLWQSTTVALRPCALLRAAVIFLSPRDLPPAPAPPPVAATLTVGPAAEPLSVTPQLFQAATRIDFAMPPGASPDLLSPPLAAPGGVLVVGGAELDTPQAAEVYLATLDGATEWTVTPWRTGPALASELVLQVPPTVGLPAAAPPPGFYTLAVGPPGSPVRSPRIPISVAPRIDGLLEPPILVPDGGGLYSVNGAGFTPIETQVMLGATVLTQVASNPAAGRFSVNAGGTLVRFRPPADLSTGSHPVRIIVGGVEASPGWRVVIP